MPVYQCYSPRGLPTKSVKAKIAEDINQHHWQRHRRPGFVSSTCCSGHAVGRLLRRWPTAPTLTFSAPSGRAVSCEIRQGMLRDLSQMWTRLPASEAEVLIWLNEANLKM